ncbi:50S ribosomal protein L37e [Metallosphaera sp. J1]|uniref:50S ribosomal protein L37e n=1 Tax=Metallosphaera TaxID=41980 RepID=UPI001EDE8EF4|nr:50S ribosomal protein L37e [Metallosphaera javensis (ex Hofmann et al. 2022)]MCG3107908.1 50S ribosomal protein L37e [Metallosphaera javensis (ex Hofmann et al. 2022)]BCS91936.1 MAG: 50S ribosomal protein L37e [Metallosphaera javensis (ex Sakai et al. 2022)]
MKGTPSFGKMNKGGSHIRCRRCGRNSYNPTKHKCAACGFGRSKRITRYSWKTKKVNGVRLK